MKQNGELQTFVEFPAKYVPIYDMTDCNGSYEVLPKDGTTESAYIRWNSIIIVQNSEKMSFKQNKTLIISDLLAYVTFASKHLALSQNVFCCLFS